MINARAKSAGSMETRPAKYCSVANYSPPLQYFRKRLDTMSKKLAQRTCYTIRHNTASIIKRWFYLTAIPGQ